MFEIPEQVRREIDNAQAVREALHVRLHLGGAEVRDQWDKLENGWQRFEGRMKVLGSESDEVASEISETLHVLAEQLRDGYDRIRALL